MPPLPIFWYSIIIDTRSGGTDDWELPYGFWETKTKVYNKSKSTLNH